MATIRTPPNQSITVKPHLQLVANAIEKEFGVVSFGTYNGHSWPEGPTQAIDIFVPLRSQLGYDVADWLVKHYKLYGVRYIMWDHRKYNEEFADFWRPVEDRGSPTDNHEDHIHLTCYEDAPINHIQEDDLFNDGDKERLERVEGEVLAIHQILNELKREVSDAFRQPNWHETGEAANSVIETVVTMLADIKKAVTDE